MIVVYQNKDDKKGEPILLCNHVVMYGAAKQDYTHQMSEVKDMEEDADVTVITVLESVVKVPGLLIALTSNQEKECAIV